jgi:hypothetical protein
MYFKNLLKNLENIYYVTQNYIYLSVLYIYIYAGRKNSITEKIHLKV